VVVDHDTRRLVWAAPGRNEATLAAFFAELGKQRCAQISHVSADGADWIARAVAADCPNGACNKVCVRSIPRSGGWPVEAGR
jgi:transposase